VRTGYGGEAISLAIDSKISSKFHAAGYAKLQTNTNYIGGLVRQFGNLSFTRVFSAGHEVPYYQPETAYKIFSRVMFNKDVATGKINTEPTKPHSKCAGVVSTKGPHSVADVTNELPAAHPQECYFWDMFETCSREQIGLAIKGAAVFEDFIMTGYDLGNGTIQYF